MNETNPVKTGAEFAVYTITPVFSSLYAGVKLKEQDQKLSALQDKVYELGKSALKTPDKMNYQESIQSLSNEVAKEESEAWKKKCEIFWVPGMLIYAVSSFIDSVFGKEKDPSTLILNALDKTDGQIKEKTSEIKDAVRQNMATYCKARGISFGTFTEIVNGLKGLDDSMFDRSIALRKIDDSLRHLGKEGYGESMVDGLLAYIQLEKETDIDKIAVYSEKIRKEFPGHEQIIESSIGMIRSLNERKAGLQKIKEEHIDPEKHATQAQERISALKQNIVKQETELKKIQKGMKECHAVIEKDKTKLGEVIYHARLGVFLREQGLDQKAIEDIEKHLKPIFIDLIRENKELELTEKPIQQQFPKLRDARRNPIDLNHPTPSDFELDVEEKLSEEGKDLNAIYMGYFKLLKDANIDNVDSPEQLRDYVNENNPLEALDEPAKAKIREIFLPLNEVLNKIEDLSAKYDQISSSISKDKEILSILTGNMKDIDQLKSQIKDEYVKLEGFKSESKKINEQFVGDKVVLEKNLSELKQLIKDEIRQLIKKMGNKNEYLAYAKTRLPGLINYIDNIQIDQYIKENGKSIKDVLKKLKEINDKFPELDERTPNEKNRLPVLNQKIELQITGYKSNLKEKEEQIKEAANKLLEFEKQLRDNERELGQLMA